MASEIEEAALAAIRATGEPFDVVEIDPAFIDTAELWEA